MNVLVPLILLLLNWGIDSTDPEVRQVVGYIFFVEHAILLAMMIYIFVRIWRSHDTRKLQVKDPYSGEVEQMTATDYDFQYWRSLLFMKLLLAVVIGHFVASRWNTPFPLLVQCFTNASMLWRSQLFQLHVLGRPEEGSLSRPWKEDTVMPEWLQQMWDQFQAKEEPRAAAGSPTVKNKKRKV